jgi:AraC-like DNA-binding protein
MLHLSLAPFAAADALPAKERREQFEIFWFQGGGEPLAYPPPVSWLCLVSLSRAYPVPPTDQPGQVLRFSREYLEEDDEEYAVDVFKLFNQSGEPPRLALSAEQDADLHAVLAVLAREQHRPAPSPLILRALLKVVLLYLIRWQQQRFTPQDVQEKRVHHFIQLMDTHYASQTQVAFYARELGVSAKRLNQILLAKLHKTATQIVHERLVLEARRELTAQKHTIKEIAFRLGFEEPSYFARFFKKHTGQSPSQFQQAISR